MMNEGVNEMTNIDIKTALRGYLDHIVDDYETWQNVGRNGRTEIQAKMLEDFIRGLDFKMGKKYVKVVIKGSVHSFIVNTYDDPKFKFGDILKAASYSAPAKNFTRGNIFEGKFGRISWAGAS